MNDRTSPAPDDWTLVYEGFDPEEEGHREALCTLGNGRFATRGAAPESRGDPIHYPGTYLAGGYNRLESRVRGRTVVNEDLVNLPNWLPVSFRAAGGRGEPGEGWVRWGEAEVMDHRVELRMREGLLVRRTRFRDDSGRETTVREERLVHMRHPRLAALRYQLVPENWSGPVEIRSELDGSVTNDGVERYRDLASRHLEVLETDAPAPDELFLRVRTTQSRLEVALAARTRLRTGDSPGDHRGEDGTGTRPRRVEEAGGRIGHVLSAKATQSDPLVLEKVVALATSRDHATSEPGVGARDALARAGDFDALRESHRVEWDWLWRRFDLEVALEPGQDARLARSQLILRLHIFHLLQTCSHNTAELDVGVPARGWHGEAYRGHVFWDEVFILPLLNLHLPEISRSLLLYRFRRLEAARDYARQEGYRGALFPWQSGSDGSEETQELHLNPRSGEWAPDHSRRQRHINAAVAWNVWQYFRTTGDLRFLRRYGAELLLEVARFWSSAATFNQERKRWEIHGVMGPDEYQEKYPDADEGGLRNNAYTNVMAVWCLEVALEALVQVGEPRSGELMEILELDDGELERWRDLTRRMFVPFIAGDDGEPVLEQFEGYGELEELDWEGYRERYGDIHRLDRILKAEGDTPDRYKASKQADATMLFFLLPVDELQRLLRRLGYAFDRDGMVRTVEYYRKRSAHGSTLSRVVYASVLNLIDPDEGWRLFQEALRSDVDDIQGGTTAEGIHLGAMAGTVDMVLRRYAGIEVAGSEVSFDPCCPPHHSGIRFQVEHGEQWVQVRVEPQTLTLTLDGTAPEPVSVRVRGRSARLQPGETRRFTFEHD